jgi:hypothetical protein
LQFMIIRSYCKTLGFIFLSIVSTQTTQSQFLMDMIDTTKEMGKGILNIYKNFDRLKMSGYIQPQFQFASAEGISSFEGGDFAPHVNNRFSLRRGRIRFDYVHFSQKPQNPTVQIVLQFDGTERGFFTRDFWGRITENNLKLFSFTAGIFARPFGFETNLGSSDRESPERGRMNQLLMRIERDIGAMISFEPRDNNHLLNKFKLDIGAFNGQGLTGTGDYDKFKDLISRAGVRNIRLTSNLSLAAAASYLYGGLRQNNRYVFSEGTSNGNKVFVVDSSAINIGRKLPRQYFGADMQLKLNHDWGATEIRGEYIGGKQTAFVHSSETPTTLPPDESIGAAQYIRKFNGAYFYFLQNIFNNKHQLVVKYDWYDPNTDVKGSDIGKPGTNLNATNIRYDTWGFGYNYYMTENIRWLFYYALVKNESTQLAGYFGDVSDNVFTCRMQFRF